MYFMERNNSKPIIIEFNGLPGTGKSTILEELNKRAQSEGWSMCRDYNRNMRLAPYSSLFKLRSYSYMPSLLRLGRTSEITKARVGQVLRCLNFINSYIDFQKYAPESLIYVLDEGIIQSLVSIAYLESFKGKEKILQNIFTRLVEHNVRWYSVDCINEPEVSYERVINRVSNMGRMDQMKKAELINALRFQVESFDIVRNEARRSGVLQSSIEIDTKKTPKENVKIIMAWINNNSNNKKY